MPFLLMTWSAPDKDSTDHIGYVPGTAAFRDVGARGPVEVLAGAVVHQSHVPLLLAAGPLNAPEPCQHFAR